MFSGDSYALEHIYDTEPDSMEMREKFSAVQSNLQLIILYKIDTPLKGRIVLIFGN